MAYKFVIPKATSLEFDKPVVFTENDRKAEPFAFLQAFREMGWRNYHVGRYEAALRNFNVVMGLHPNDKRSMTGRAFARAALTLYEGGQQDAVNVLNQDPEDAKAMYIQALCEYELGNFEDALVMFHRGMNRRGPRVEFRDGRYQCEGTLEDTIGRFAGPMLTNMKSDMKKMLDAEERERLKRLRQKCAHVDNLDLEPDHPCSPYEWQRYIRQQERLNNVMAEIYLGRLVYDKKWIKIKLKDPNLNSCNREGAAKMRELLEVLLKDIDKRQEILRERKPMYYVKEKLAPYEKSLARNRKKQEVEMARTMKFVCRNYLNKMKKERFLKNTRQCSDYAISLKKYLMKCPSRILKDKKKITKEMSRIAAFAYMDLKKFKPDLTKDENHERISLILGYDPIYNEQKLDPLVQESKFPYMNYKAHIVMFEDWLETSSILEERAWLYYEVGRNYEGMHKFEHMTLRGKKCAAAAVESNDPLWIINGAFMQVVGLMRDKNKEEALKLLDESINQANKLNYQDVCQFLFAAQKVMLEKEMKLASFTPNQIENRQQDDIVKLIEDPEKKMRLQNIFSSMRVLAFNRRMTVVPGLKLKNERICNINKKSIIRGGQGGRQSVHTMGLTTYQEFINE